MVAPDCHPLDLVIKYTSFEGQLAFGSILIQSSQRVEVFGVKFWSVLHCDESIGIARVSDYNNFAVLVR